MYWITTDYLAAVVVDHAASAEDALAGAASLFDVDLDALPLVESVGWLRGLDLDLLAISADPAHASLWPLLGDLRKAAARRTSELLGEDRYFSDGDDLLRQLGVDGAEGLAWWVEGRLEDGDALVVDVHGTEREVSGGLVFWSRCSGFDLFFPMLESALIAAIHEGEKQCTAAGRAGYLLRCIENPEEAGESPDASWISTPDRHFLCDDLEHVRMLLALADQLGVAVSSPLKRGNAFNAPALRDLQMRIITELGLPDAPPDNPEDQEKA